MLVVINVILKEGTDEESVISSFESNSQVTLKNRLVSLPDQLTFKVEEDYVDTFITDDRFKECNVENQVPVSTALTYEYQTGRVITEAYPSLSTPGVDYMPLQLYDDSDVFPQTTIIGNDPDDDTNNLANVTYYSAFFGKHVDIVTIEVGPALNTYNTWSTGPHPDSTDPDAPSNSRFIPMDWPDLEEAGNNQVTNNLLHTQHGIGVLSAAAGRYCGFAKKANLRQANIESLDSATEIINAVISWHNSKGNNPDTGVPNPTILIGEFQYLNAHSYCVEIEDIASITDLNGTVTKPQGGWGTDFTPFTSRNIFPRRILRNDNTYKWAVSAPTQAEQTSLKNAVEAAWDAGIVWIGAAGNQAEVYVKRDDPRKEGVFITTEANHTYIQSNINSQGILTGFTEGSITNSQSYRVFKSYGPHGTTSGKGIDVAAGQNSQKYPILDGYSSRGPGIDIIGKGSDTWTSYPVASYTDGQWGYFGGTSCATPTVVGKAACEMEKYFYYNGSWPTPSQVREILLSNSKLENYGVDSTNWSNVGSPSSGFTVTESEGGATLATLLRGNSLNGGAQLADAADTTSARAFFDGRGFKRNNTYDYRKTSGVVYPRQKTRKKG